MIKLKESLLLEDLVLCIPRGALEDLEEKGRLVFPYCAVEVQDESFSKKLSSKYKMTLVYNKGLSVKINENSDKDNEKSLIIYGIDRGKKITLLAQENNGSLRNFRITCAAF